MRDTREQELALECLKLAISCGVPAEPDRTTIDRASAFYAFVTGTDTDDARRAVELSIRLAEEAARQVGDAHCRASRPENGGSVA